MYNDICLGVAETSQFHCSVCELPYASVPCGVETCAQMCHFTCGLMSNWLFQFDEMNAFCHEHTGLPAKTPMEFGPGSACLICAERFNSYSALKCIPTHCRPDIWMHRFCLQRFAFCAGIDLKCLLCHKPEFRNIAQKYGVFVPNRKGDWMRIHRKEVESQKARDSIIFCAARVCIFAGGRQFPPGCEVGGTCFDCHQAFHTTCAFFNNRKRKNGKLLCLFCDGVDPEISEPLDMEPKKTNLVLLSTLPIFPNLAMKKFLQEVFTNKVNYVDESLMPNSLGQQYLRQVKFRLNYFLNSF
ncbi:G2/M phase-specific E3 ubiquitin-protein ligase [Phlebotomus argentipes]|uniref:G2/M phase-specific E3 ubiquitin-protein ligase n=1 Tax=Phlebotomus argentipes TaxID=94469 RepID=UPI002892EE76|nr:G2/M phase-specific E3 ubiquitin-protein ligase [Phlebotomus argentipes]